MSGGELKPCPLCGSTSAPYVYATLVKDWFGVCCDDDRGGCDVRLTQPSRDAAIVAWNTRAALPSTTAVADMRVDWQPIESAPRDGTAILCYNPMVGVYNSAWQQDLGDSCCFPCGFWSRLGSWFCAPTHWRPLPAPPAESPQG